MVPDHACVPGLDQPVSVSEYATLKGAREADVFAAIRALKVPTPRCFWRQRSHLAMPLPPQIVVKNLKMT
jgi:hypothetical protein